MDTLYINGFDKFIAEDNKLLVEDDNRKNALHILEVINTGRNFGFICASNGIDSSKTAGDKLNQLEEDIIRIKCSYIPFSYGYGYVGQGECIVRHKDTGLFVSGIELTQLLELGKKYSQDVVVFGDKEEIKSFKTTDGTADVILGFEDMKLAMCTILFFPGTFRGR